MPTTLSSREFNQDVGRAKKAAQQGPVFITDRGQPSHVLMTITEYRKLTGKGLSLAEAVGDPDSADFEFDPPRMSDRMGFKPVDFD
jgi:prevent-host-death family protein